MAWAFIKSKEYYWPWILSYTGAVFYTYIHRYYISNRFAPKRFEQEEKLRPLRLSAAISRLTLAAHSGEYTDKELTTIERTCMEDIRSEVQAKIGDERYVGVNIIVPDEHNGSQVVCINRTDLHRGFPKTYPKDSRNAWKCMNERRVLHQGKIDGKGYRSYICFPLAVVRGDDTFVTLGAVTIDHQDEYAFEGLESDLEDRLLPYFRVLELALVHRRRLTPPPAAPVTKKGSNKPPHR